MTATLRGIAWDRYRPDDWLTVDEIADWVGMSRRSLYYRLRLSEAPLELSKWGKRSGATAKLVRRWYRHRLFERER